MTLAFTDADVCLVGIVALELLALGLLRVVECWQARRAK